MKALSLTQPWATLIAIGAKTWETRSWPTKYRGEIAIHASLNQPKWARDLEHSHPLFSAALYPNGRYLYPFLSCGKIIAIAELTDCRRTEEFFAPGSVGTASRGGVIIPAEEWAFGDFNAFRFAFKLEKVRRVSPMKCKGALGLWTVPDAIEMAIREEIGAVR